MGKMKMNNTFGWNIKAQLEDDSDSAEIELYGEVLSEQPRDWWTGEKIEDMQCICPEGFAEAIEPLKGKKNITVRLNTVGGDATVGLFICNKLKALKENGTKINVIVDGLAASAGSIIMCAGDTISVYSNSMIMIHEAKSSIWGCYSVADLKKIENGTKAYNDMIVATYVQKTGLSEEKLRGMIQRETWFIGQEAVDNGFADEVLDGESSLSLVASAGSQYMCGGNHAVKADFFIPQRIKDKLKQVIEQNEVHTDDSVNNADESVKNSVVNKIENQKGENPMDEIKTVAELEKAYPELCAEIKNSTMNGKTDEVVAAERKRIKDIEDISFRIADKSLVEKAKYEGGITAADLLMQDALAEKERNEKIVANLDNDAGVANSVPASATKVETEELEKPLTKAERYAKGVAAAKANQKGE